MVEFLADDGLSVALQRVQTYVEHNPVNLDLSLNMAAVKAINSTLAGMLDHLWTSNAWTSGEVAAALFTIAFDKFSVEISLQDIRTLIKTESVLAKYRGTGYIKDEVQLSGILEKISSSGQDLQTRILRGVFHVIHSIGSMRCPPLGTTFLGHTLMQYVMMMRNADSDEGMVASLSQMMAQKLCLGDHLLHVWLEEASKLATIVDAISDPDTANKVDPSSHNSCAIMEGSPTLSPHCDHI